MYNTKNKKVTQHSGIQCVNWDEATEGEKSFLGRKDSGVWKYQGEAKKKMKQLKQEDYFSANKPHK